jgi:hypothetical protein
MAWLRCVIRLWKGENSDRREETAIILYYIHTALVDRLVVLKDDKEPTLETFSTVMV